MTPTAAARASQASTPSLRDRLKDPSLLREPLLHRRRLGRHAVASRDQSGQRRRAGEGAGHEHRGSHAGGRSRRARVSGLGQAHRQAALQHLAQMVRPDHRQPRGSRADPDLRAGQAAGGSARRSRYRRRLCRVLRRGSAPRLWRDHSDAAAGCAAARDQAADRRLRRDHAVEFPVLDDHPQGVAGAGRRLHRGAQARQRDAADARWRWSRWPRRPACRRACSTSSPAIRRRSARCCASIRPCASSASPARPRSARSSISRPPSA